MAERSMLLILLLTSCLMLIQSVYTGTEDLYSTLKASKTEEKTKEESSNRYGTHNTHAVNNNGQGRYSGGHSKNEKPYSIGSISYSGRDSPYSGSRDSPYSGSQSPYGANQNPYSGSQSSYPVGQINSYPSSSYSERYNEREPSERCQVVSLGVEEIAELRRVTEECTDFLKKNLRNNKKVMNHINGDQKANEELLETALKEFGVKNIYLDKKYPLQSFILQYQTYMHEDIKKMISNFKTKRTKFSRVDDQNDDEIKPFDCWDILESGKIRSGVYTIYPRRGMSIQVYCDMETEGGGWTVFLARKNQTKREDFYRNWNDYKNGFGNPSTEYWLGNEALHIMTNMKTYTIRVEAEDYEEKKVWGELQEFKISSERSKYKLYCYSYNPRSTIGSDIFNYHFGMSFSTYDNDNDEWGDINCAENKQGGWWYKDCAWFNPTGVADSPSFNTGIVIFKWSTKDTSSRILKSVQLKMRPTQNQKFR